MGDFVFPDAGWSDVVVVILGWWRQALRALPQHQGAEAYFIHRPRPSREAPIRHSNFYQHGCHGPLSLAASTAARSSPLSMSAHCLDVVRDLNLAGHSW